MSRLYGFGSHHNDALIQTPLTVRQTLRLTICPSPIEIPVVLDEQRTSVANNSPWRRGDTPTLKVSVGVKQTSSERRSNGAIDPGCVKTCTHQKSLESFSKNPQVAMSVGR
jgi:hypothetical protein